uniref:Large ribosomal subunit protein uL22m n=1 Tax=Ascaris lumbricoides TaxID=6252 RepID=A0A0M3IIR0_ASCLU
MLRHTALRAVYLWHRIRPTRFARLCGASSDGRRYRSTYADQKTPRGFYPNTDVPLDEAWRRRIRLRNPTLQRDEQVRPKLFYAPEWDLSKKPDGEEGYPDPLKGYGMTPEKWEYQNKVVWPPNYVNPETGLPKLREVFHCRESIHFSPKRMWFACQLAWRMNVDEAILQLKFHHTKACLILKEVLEEAKQRAEKEFHVEFPSEMHVAEAFPIQSEIIKGARRHAHEIWHTIRYRYIHVFVRLEEGEGPGTKRRERLKDGWEKMEEYYAYLRSRQIKYSI